MAQEVPVPVLQSAPKKGDFAFFKRNLEYYFIVAETDDAKKLPILMTGLGRDGQDIYDGLKEPKTTYAESIERLEEYFGASSSILVRRKDFYQSRQDVNESITEYACKLRRLAKDCDFGATLNNMLRDIFVMGVRNNHLGERLLAEDPSKLTFEEACKQAEAFERARAERRNVIPTASASAELHQASSVQRKIVCYRCGRPDHKASHPRCPARKAICKACSKVGHFQIACRSRDSKSLTRTSANQHTPRYHGRRDQEHRSGGPMENDRGLHTVTSEPNEPDEKQLTEYNLYAAGASKLNLREVEIEGSAVQGLIDTGAEKNILPRHLAPQHRQWEKTDISIRAFGGATIPVLGEITCSVSYRDHNIMTKFVIVDVKTDFALLSAPLCKSLNMLAELCAVLSDFETLIETYDQKGLFKGLGEVKNVSHQITIKQDVKPFACPPRRLPPALVQEVQNELDRLVEDGVIRKIEEPTSWSSPLVVAKKPNNKLRICMDLRRLNKAIQRPNFEIPNPEDIFASISGSSCYSKLDCKNAFHQIPVHPSSQPLLAFSTPSGRYCWTRLPYGIKSAPEIFQKILSDILCNVPNTYMFFDDILIATASEEEHRQILAKVFQALSDHGVTLNYEKCKFACDKIEFLGHILSKEGISPSPGKVSDVAQMDLPPTREKLRSFLGMASWLGQKFVPHFASLAAPLWDLVNPKNPFLWTEQLRESFFLLRKAIVDIATLSWFDFKKTTVIYADASGDGLGCCLTQDDKPIAYASRRLTPIEQRYSVIEREFLAIVFALKKFRRLILFSPCEVRTDHRPIIGLLDKKIDSLPFRIQRWILFVQGFDVHFAYFPGSSNKLADALSRNPSPQAIDQTEISDEEDAECTICFIARSLPLDLKQVALSTVDDEVLQEVLEAVECNWPAKYSKLIPYYSFRDELSVKHNGELSVLFKGSRVVLPSSLRQEFIQQVHEGHLGSTKMKEVIRRCAYWPGFSNDIDEFCRRCSSCQIFSDNPDRPPIRPIAEKLQAPGQQVAVDITGPSEATSGKILLTVIDLFSRYPDVFVLRSSSSSEIICNLRKWFSQFGIPENLLSDNGTPFVSSEMHLFLQSIGVRHLRSANFHPQSNGCIERFHRTLKCRLKRVMLSHNVSFECALDKVLFDIRASPHAMTGRTPAFLFLGREIRTKESLLSAIPFQSSKRSAEKEYEKRASFRCSEYLPGDSVLYRKGQRCPFIYKGRIVRKVSPYSYQLEDNSGFLRIYNQRDLKPSFDAYDNSSLVADDAYDYAKSKPLSPSAAITPQCAPKMSSPGCSTPVPGPVPSHGYNLRPRVK